MKQHFNCTEEDIFIFVFNPGKLSDEKLEYLKSNQDLFKKEIDYCVNLRDKYKSVDVESITEDIVQKIKSFKPIELYPQIVKPKKENGVKLAAASILTEKKPSSISFTDAESKYLIRIVKTESETLLYLFTEDKSKTNYTIHFLPSESEYKMASILEPIEIIEEDLIESITLS